jgi:hypothetical protein
VVTSTASALGDVTLWRQLLQAPVAGPGGGLLS